ncbi:MAG: SpoIID/LytB domain-containing protein [Puniceicoccales bacterium]|nr:SpoIID/LytB domain-containing protein [Puniceicoccales bacterium]
MRLLYNHPVGMKMFWRGVYVLVVAVVFFCRCNAATCQEDQHFVRVAISDNQFKNFSYDEIEIMAPNGCTVRRENSHIPLAKIPRGKPVKIKLNGETFSLASGKNINLEDIRGTITVECQSGGLGICGLRRNKKQALYGGKFEIRLGQNGKFFVVNVIELEEYLKGVILSEMPAKFSIEALKAQAVAARSYALLSKVKNFSEFDLLDSSTNQMYLGMANQLPKGNRAVESTAGIVAMCDGKPILPLYFSTSCGHTENCENVFSSPKTNSFPGIRCKYLVGVPDDGSVGNLWDEETAKKFYKSRPNLYDSASPHFRWVQKWRAEELEEILRRTLLSGTHGDFVRSESSGGDKFGKILKVNVKKRGVSGKIIELEVITTENVFSVRKDAVIRSVFEKNGKPLPSANVAFEHTVDKNGKLSKIYAYGGGFGHGVGMSQYGANFMATRLHKNFEQILKKYYGGISIATIPMLLHIGGTKKSVAQSFCAPKRSAFLVIGGDGKTQNLEAKINGVALSFPLKCSGKPETSKIDVSRCVHPGKNEVEFSCAGASGEGTLRVYFEFF